MEKKYVLVLDHDGIFHPNELIEEYIKRINYLGTLEYAYSLMKAYDNNEITQEEKDEKTEEHRYIRNMILEETGNYKKIPYKKIYTLENANMEAIITLFFIYDLHIFNEIVFNSHRNCERDLKAKTSFDKQHLSIVDELYFPLFHSEKYDPTLVNLYNNNKRIRTDKADFLMKQRHIHDLRGYYGVDDSAKICKEYERCNGKSFYKSNDISVREVLLKAARECFCDRLELAKQEGKDVGGLLEAFDNVVEIFNENLDDYMHIYSREKNHDKCGGRKLYTKIKKQKH